ncbi:MAG: hypothetical protein PHY42_04730 [Bacilli bacterium]|nr:hypothetical protein [Bacilli bacterium]
MLDPILSFAGLGLAFGFIVANIIGNKKTCVVSIIFFVIALVVHLAKHVQQLQTYYNQFLGNIPYLKLIGFGIIGLALIISLISYITAAKKKNEEAVVFRQAKLLENTNVLVYMSPNGRVLQISKKLNELLHNSQKELALKTLTINDEVVDHKKIDKNLFKYGKKTNEPMLFQFLLNNNLTINMKMVKKEVYLSRKLVGYILLDAMTSVDECNENMTNLKRSFYIYFDLMDEPVAFFDEDQKNYVASRNLMEFLRVEENQIPLDQMRQIMHPDDLPIFDGKKVETDKYSRIQYRLSTKTGYSWFEEGSGNFFGKNFTVLKKIKVEDGSNLTFGTYKAFVSQVEANIEAKKTFAIALLNLHSIPELSQTKGKEFANIALTKYFAKINNGVLKDQVQMYKIGAIEYALIIEGQEYFELLIRDFNNNVSEIMMQEIYVNKVLARVEAQVGMVLSKDISNPEARAMIKAAFDSLKEATDPEFLKDYSIYQPKEEISLDYSLQDLGIDFEKDDLKQFMEDVKK